MKIASYNIYNGAHASLPELEEFVKQQDLDVLCLQEANDWLDGSPSQLDKFAAASGLINVVSGGNSRFKIATLSRLPFARTEVHTDKFWHGAVETEVETPEGVVDLWNTHLFPFNEDGRIAEADYIANHIDTRKQTLVVGDFNSLSETDEYPEDFARIYRSRTEGKSKDKFGIDSNRYDVTRRMPNGGLYDIAALMEARTDTVPTPVNKDEAHAFKLRLDYMFATESLIRRVKAITVPKTELTDQISDHYPQVLTLGE